MSDSTRSAARASTHPPGRRRLVETSGGTLTDAFGLTEWGLLGGIAVIWGSSFLLMEIGLTAFRPGVVTMARVALGAAALALVPRARRPIDRDDLPRVGLLGVLWVAIPLSLFPIAQQWIDSSVAGMINGAVPITTAAWATLLLRRVPGRIQLLGIMLGFGGVVAIFYPELRGSSATTLGASLVVLAIVLYGLSANMVVPLQQRYGALPVLLRAQLAALAVVVPIGVWQLPGSTFSWGPALAMVPLGMLSTGLAFVFMATLVGRVGGPRGSVAIYFVPVVAVFLGVFVLGERVEPLAVAGTVLVLLGAWFTSRREV
ncbi:MAG: DMT family transporter [Actinobacteria bacterium]|nr:DMT family transporter [Actinomycetota bacterium]